MRLSSFDFHLPEALIAQTPAVPRDSARLFVYDRSSDRIQHRLVRDLPSLLPAHTTLVANNSRVRKARLHAQYQDRTFEILVLEEVGGLQRCIIGGRGIKAGMVLTVAPGVSATVVSREAHTAMNTYLLRFSKVIEEVLDEFGSLPLPPYIKGTGSREEQYQTVYANPIGSAAAPTAGLHFTPELLAALKKAGHNWQEVTLHVGMGTFLPLRHEEITANTLHSEWTAIDEKTASFLNAHPGTLLAVGTTATRTLESHSQNGQVQPGEQRTEIFMYPGYRFQVVSHLLTNFHLPKSSLLLLVAAFLGNDVAGTITRTEPEMIELLHRLYREAIAEQYRFFSFGDAMLIL